ISVYLEQRLPLFRKTPWFLDRLWDSPSVIKAASSRWVRTDPRLLGELTVSVLKGETGFQRKEILKLLHWLSREAPPEVVNLPNSLLIGLARPIKKSLNRPVVCTLQGEDLFLEGLLEPYKKQALELIRAGVDCVDLFVPVSQYHARFMADYLGIPRDKIRVIPLGINLDGYSPTRRSRTEPFRVGYLARVTPEKGLHVLCETYRRMRRDYGLPASRLEAAGYLAHEHQDYLRGIERKMKEWGLGEEFQYRGVLTRQEKLAFLKTLDVFSVPATYDDPKGIYVLEAMASGVPVVQPRRGAFTEMIESTAGGLLVDSGDDEALARGILSIWKNPALGEELSRKGAEGVRRHYSITRMAEGMIEAYEHVLESASPRVTASELAEFT
ncbi:MAG: glycosyltransferase family 4 protein, partial [Acidobacteria bacterium]|nr:glycosyltransferase family 4 protein [Acidobacteriota bacterium]